jgi:catechol 2,3-dioxygenase-like lactoylglutathione lyase family enzyme
MKLPLLLLPLALTVSALAVDATPSAALQRPRIVGLSHAAFYVSDMAKARQFYENFLGYEAQYTVPRPKAKGAGELVCIKINDHQSVELFPGAEVAADAPRLYHIAVEVDDAEAMRVYLKSRGVEVPDKTPQGKVGNANYFIKDPSGNIVEIVEYLPTGLTAQGKGKFLPETRISLRMRHVGVMIAKLDEAKKFYEDILGFKEIWRGSNNPTTLSWVHMRVPDGDDFIEFMLYEKFPPLDRIHTMEHICLEVPDIEKTDALLKTRPYPEGSKAPTPMKAGVNGKRQINYYDPDGTRVEIMEPNTFDGKPRPPSTAPAPVGEPRPVVPAKA